MVVEINKDILYWEKTENSDHPTPGQLLYCEWWNWYTDETEYCFGTWDNEWQEFICADTGCILPVKRYALWPGKIPIPENPLSHIGNHF